MIDVFTEPRPNRFDKDIDVNSKDYHNKMGRYFASSVFTLQNSEWVGQYYTNLNFFLGNQWINTEDTEIFLKDTSQQSRNRIKVKCNYILPDVAQYVGNAIAMDITIRASSLSTRARTRRESKLEEQLLLTDIANKAPNEIAQGLRDQFGIGNNKKETETIFYNLWQDNYVNAINGLMTFVAEKNNFKQLKKELAMSLCLSGLCVMRYREWNGDLIWDYQQPDRFFYDRSAQRADLSDAEFQGCYDTMLPSEIYEKWNVSTEDKHNIQNAIQNAATDNNQYAYVVNGKMPIFDIYWKDSISYQSAYVMDEYQYPKLEKINYKEEGQKEPKYTEKDVIKYDKLNETQRRVLNGVAKTKKDIAEKWLDIIRFITFIPKEIIGFSNKDGNDVILDYGIMPYQDTNGYDYTSCKFPFKVGTWYFVNGYATTPISELINPQRIINRYESVKEHIVNSSMPSSLAYDLDALPPDGEKALLKNIYEGKPVGLRARGTGINNAISKTSSTLDTNSIRTFAELHESMHQTMGIITGVNESLLGQSQGSDQLVGVTQLQIQRGSLIQEPFYSALVGCFEQAYQTTADVGKRIYADNERELAIAIGDENVEVIKITKDMKLEDFRIFIHREADMDKQKAAADALIMQFAKVGMIDKQGLADLGGRSTPDEVWSMLRKRAAEEKVAATLAQPQQQAQQQAAVQQQQAQVQQENNLANQEQIDKRDATLSKNQTAKENTQTMANAKVAVKQMDVASKQNQK